MMKTIGLLAGLSWESSAHYYQLINQSIQKQLGGLHSADILMASVDFDPIQQWQHDDQWFKIENLLVKKALKLQAAGADGIVICSNTIHKIAESIEHAINVPLLHIADATGKELQRRDLHKPLLLGTEFTMQQEFYKGHLQKNYFQLVSVPSIPQQADIHRIIYQELCKGKVNPTSKDIYLEIINQYQGVCDSVILGCTEIGMLVQQEGLNLPVLDTTDIHCNEIVDWMLGQR